jgi:hypothetical protein
MQVVLTGRGYESVEVAHRRVVYEGVGDHIGGVTIRSFVDG